VNTFLDYLRKNIKLIRSELWLIDFSKYFKLGIENFRWHDLRHTWASWHVQAGTPLHVLQELGGWECVEMVRKYAHLSSEHLSGYVDRLSRLKLIENDQENLATIGLR